METIFDICQGILVTGTHGKVAAGAQNVADGLVPRQPPLKPGLVEITPEQALSIVVEDLSLNGNGIEGYQRSRGTGRDIEHARRIAKAMQAGVKVAPVNLAADSGRLYAPDGVHRILGGVIGRKVVLGSIELLNYEERRQRFGAQGFAKRVPADVLCLAQRDKIALYIRDAIEAKRAGDEHPWASIVGIRADRDLIGANVAYQMLIAYTLGILGGGSLREVGRDRLLEFSSTDGAELASLLRTFGTKSTTALAYRPPALLAITDLAVLALMRAGKPAELFTRWHRHMASFTWTGWRTRRRDILVDLVQHWNKRLSASRKVHLD